MGETMSFNEFKRLTFCNSKTILNKKFIIDNKVHDWVGIGIIETGEKPDPEKHVTITEE